MLSPLIGSDTAVMVRHFPAAPMKPGRLAGQVDVTSGCAAALHRCEGQR